MAIVELMADGTIGAIDSCTSRLRVYRNAVLLDLVLCLAARIDHRTHGQG